MRSTLDELLAEIRDLRALLMSIGPVNSALADHTDSAVRQYLTIRRRFDYAAFIVALYAAFERFAENLVIARVRLAAGLVPYAQLPATLTKKHTYRSAELLGRGRLGEGRYAHLSELVLVRNLHDCLSGATAYELNDAAVVAHDYNLSSEELTRLFSAIGIENICDRVRRVDELVSWFTEINSLPKPPTDGVPASTVQTRLDGLVDRRNQVTHRGNVASDLLGFAEMEELLSFIEAFGRAVFATTVAHYLRAHHVDAKLAASLALTEGPYGNGTVVVVERKQQRLYVGQPSFVFVGTHGVRWGRITEIRVDDVAMDVIDGDSNVAEAGLAVTFKCPRKGTQLFVLDADDDAVWAPLVSASVASAN